MLRTSGVERHRGRASCTGTQIDGGGSSLSMIEAGCVLLLSLLQLVILTSSIMFMFISICILSISSSGRRRSNSSTVVSICIL